MNRYNPSWEPRASMHLSVDGRYVVYETHLQDKADALASLHRQYAEVVKAAKKFTGNQPWTVKAVMDLEAALANLPGDETP